MAIWFGNPTIEKANAAHVGLLASHLGIEFTELGADYLRGQMRVEPRVHQPMGYLHGGASVVLAESLGSVGSAMHAYPDRIAVGVDINATHHRSATSGIVTGTATAIHLGRTSAAYEIVIVDEAGKRLCTSRITCALIEPR